MEDLKTSEEERKGARRLHSTLLFNLVVNHIFFFLMALTLIRDIPFLIGLSAIISIGLLTYILISAKRALKTEPSWYVRCHLQFAAKRARIFLYMFLALGTLSFGLFYGGQAMGMKDVMTWALTGGLGLLPFMVGVLALIVIEFDAEHQAKVGKVPAGALANYPRPEENA